MTPDEFLTELASALSEYRFRDVRALTEAIDPAAFSLPQIRKALGLIRGKRLFGELAHVASLFHMVGHNEPVVRRQWAQALLDQNQVTPALRALESMSTLHAEDPYELSQVRGLLGRAYKQLYVNEGGQENLQRAIAAYRPDWESRTGDYRWNGINLVALLDRARRDGVRVPDVGGVNDLAQTILDDIDRHGATGAWDLATAMEAYIAQGRTPEALSVAADYVKHPGADAFELASTLRQLEEVWVLHETEVGKQILPVLTSALLDSEGARVKASQLSTPRDREGFEAVWGKEGMVRMALLEAFQNACQAIARVCDNSTQKPEGTGFLARGDELGVRWNGHLLFLTNAHVVSNLPEDEAPLRPEDAVAEFTRPAKRSPIRLGQMVFSSPRTALDVSIFEIEMPQDAASLKIYPYSPSVSDDPERRERVYVIGHPNGADLSISLYDNAITDCETPYVRYRSPTEPGNSGSPVFNAKARSFAIHHRALYDRQLNEGISLAAVKDAFERVIA